MATFEAAGLAAARTLPGVRVPVDHDHLARYTFGNRALELEVLNLFADQAPEYLARLREARSDKEWRDAAHTLKGSARAVGAVCVAELAERAEAWRMLPEAEERAIVLDDLAEAVSEARSHIALLDLQH